MIKESDLLALQLVEPAFLLAEIGDHCRHLVPVSCAERKYPIVDAAVRGTREAVAEGRHGNLVLGDATEEAVGDAGRQRFDGRGAAIVLFQPLVTFNTLGSVVLGLAFLPLQVHAVDATAHVDKRPVVDRSAIVARPTRGVGSHPI